MIQCTKRVTNNLVVTGTINTSNGLDISSKSPEGLLQIEM